MKTATWLTLLDAFECWKMDSLKIAGMEPTLHPNLFNLIAAAKSHKIDNLSLTTNGSNLARMLPNLIDNGLSRVTISFHSLDPYILKQITQGNVVRILDSLDVCADYGIQTKLNVVLLKGVNDDISTLLEYAAIQGFELKLYQLLWQPHYTDDYKRYFISWEDVIEPFVADWNWIECTDFVESQRYRYTFETENDVKVTTSGFRPKNNSKYHLCRKCSLNLKCEEGFMGYGFEIDSNLKMNPCYLRSELKGDLEPFLKKNYCHIRKYLNRMAFNGGIANEC